VADALVVLGPGLIWKAARSLDGKPAPWAMVVLGGVVAGLASASPATRAAICSASKIATPCGPQTTDSPSIVNDLARRPLLSVTEQGRHRTEGLDRPTKSGVYSGADPWPHRGRRPRGTRKTSPGALAAGLGSAGRGTLIGRVLSMGGDQIMPRQQRLFERNFPVVIAALPQQSIYLWVLLDELLVCT
jgi:hypothetical protein